MVYNVLLRFFYTWPASSVTWALMAVRWHITSDSILVCLFKDIGGFVYLLQIVLSHIVFEFDDHVFERMVVLKAFTIHKLVFSAKLIYCVS